MSCSRGVVFRVIDQERDYQEKLWGNTPSKGKHEIGAFILFIEQYVDKAKDAITQFADPTGSDQALHQLRKVAALCVACMEQHGAAYRSSSEPTPEDFRKHLIKPKHDCDSKPEYDGAPYSTGG